MLFRLVLQIVICFFSFVKKTGVYRKNQQGYTRQSLIAIHERKRSRLNYWKPFLSREISIVLVIAWYIKIELLRTKQLPSYITFNGIDRVPSLTKNIEKEASKVYSLMFKNDDDVNKFFFADTGNRTLDGKLGKTKSFDYDLNCYNAEIVPKRGVSVSVPSVVSISTENMEPFKRIMFRKYKHVSSKESCLVKLENHFPHQNCLQPCITFYSKVFQDAGGLTRRLDLEGTASRDRIANMIQNKEAQDKMEMERKETMCVELQLGLARLHATRSPVKSRPRKKIRATQNPQRGSRSIQLHSIWRAKIEHYISQNEEKDRSGEEDHLFSFPFHTTDNSLHSCATGLVEFCPLNHENHIHDAMYGKKNFASHTIIDSASIRSLTPLQQMNSNVFDFCLSW